MTNSPLRYPGGKGRMYNVILEIMRENDLLDRSYVEPFAGGFGIGIKMLTNEDVGHVILNDADIHIYAFWHCVFFDTTRLIKRIRGTDITLENWTLQKEIYQNYNGRSLLKYGFSAFYLNRTNFSGIIKGGPLGGIAQTSNYKIDCRTNKEGLIAQILAISEFRERVEMFNLDALDFIDQVIIPRIDDLFVNFDPPYVLKGKDLYRNFYNKDDHEMLAAKIIENLNEGQWIMTYDDCDLIKELYAQFNPEEYTLNHYAGKKKTGKELLIRNL